MLRAWAFPTVLYSLLWASICPRLLKCWLCRVVRAPAGWLIPPRLAMQPEPTTAVLYRKNNCVQTSRLQSITTWAAFFQKKKITWAVLALIGCKPVGHWLAIRPPHARCHWLTKLFRCLVLLVGMKTDRIRYDWTSTSQIYYLSIRIWIRYRILNIGTRIRIDLNPSKRIRSRIRSENIRTVFIPTY